ncbi:pyridoxine 5'-phosphate synthase [Porphyromonas sp. COT-290 OH3588]|uniref:pyridoxine 5'-phosphate synthase n=1 Tax=Porphyromonas sp. COT-290 OH3588 TaxID=1515617 RepID=UPI00052D8010|nr:pyridoxine 5'-phosphate synthase [Porphyromonas sp. COT-290 OH3588]KGO00316.1 pyridoxamine 5'-phosphate oxidase [Porphyromonas sp. COT-290 OH3588]
MTKLSVNINKVATIRNARGGNVPNVKQVALDLERFGSDGITVHPRPDERHIRYRDVYELSEVLTTEFNIEGNPIESFMRLIQDVRPAQATLVPDAPDALTSNAGWQVEQNFDFLKGIIDDLHRWQVRASIFVGTDLDNIRWAARTGADRVELYTEPYAALYPQDPQRAVTEYIEAAQLAKQLGLGVNAGHDLSLDNLGFFHQAIPELDEVSIGHALISEALYLGLEKTVARYQRALGK